MRKFMIDKSLGPEFRVIHNMINKYMSNSLSAVSNITQPQFVILGYLMHNTDKDIFQRDIENEFSISRATASNTLQVMERNGLIKRVAIAEDARLKKILLTKKGENASRMCTPYILRLENAMMNGFSDEEIDLLLNFLKRIQANLENVHR
ncbi:MAG: MarR family winged helix-turn-helix transcriptional regulator [Bacteroides sp.]